MADHEGHMELGCSTIVSCWGGGDTHLYWGDLRKQWYTSNTVSCMCCWGKDAGWTTRTRSARWGKVGYEFEWLHQTA